MLLIKTRIRHREGEASAISLRNYSIVNGKDMILHKTEYKNGRQNDA
ncbi:MAG: hypothetical protein WAK17_03835 [Candidatus Nitrosopolaris sp.]|jgi:hypothetical protein